MILKKRRRRRRKKNHIAHTEISFSYV